MMRITGLGAICGILTVGGLVTVIAAGTGTIAIIGMLAAIIGIAIAVASLGGTAAGRFIRGGGRFTSRQAAPEPEYVAEAPPAPESLWEAERTRRRDEDPNDS
jgi:hypothetical protein